MGEGLLILNRLSIFCLFLLTMGLYQCSNSPRDKIIRGKEITKKFFLQNTGDYKNGTFKHLKFYKDPQSSQYSYQQSFTYGVEAFALKESSGGFRILTARDSDYYNNSRINVFFECQKTYSGQVNRVEEIPSNSENSNMSEEFKSVKTNPIPFKYFLYLEYPQTDKVQINHFYEPQENKLSEVDFANLKRVSESYCSEYFQSYYPGESFTKNSYNNDQTSFALTEIQNSHFLMLNSKDVSSQSKMTYKPMYGLQNQNKYSILNDIEYFSESVTQQSVPLQETRFIEGISGKLGDFLSESYRHTDSFGGSDTKIQFAESKSGIELTAEAKDSSCNKTYRVKFNLAEVNIINEQTKRSELVQKGNTNLSLYSNYLKADGIFRSSPTLVEMTKSTDTPDNCRSVQKFLTAKNQNILLPIAFRYTNYYQQLSVLILDSDLTIIDQYDDLSKESVK